jgi:hypothetical protein
MLFKNHKSICLESNVVFEYITYTLISTSTPLGNSNFISASIVFDEEL